MGMTSEIVASQTEQAIKKVVCSSSIELLSSLRATMNVLFLQVGHDITDNSAVEDVGRRGLVYCVGGEVFVGGSVKGKIMLSFILKFL